MGMMNELCTSAGMDNLYISTISPVYGYDKILLT